jgi:hypothetical protein
MKNKDQFEGRIEKESEVLNGYDRINVEIIRVIGKDRFMQGSTVGSEIVPDTKHA